MDLTGRQTGAPYWGGFFRLAEMGCVRGINWLVEAVKR